MSVMHPTLPGFFLTRQAANILEDLSREVHRSGSVHVIFGQSGTGKSSLIDYFLTKRLNTLNFSLIRITENQGFLINDETEARSLNELIHYMDKASAKADVLVIDQLERLTYPVIGDVLKQFKSSIQDHNLSLILICDHEIVAALNEQASSLELLINGVELKPLNRKEQVSFLSASCCDGYRQNVLLTASQTKQLKKSKGAFRELIRMTQQPIHCKSKMLGQTKSHLNTLLIIFFIASVTLIYAVTRHPPDPHSTQSPKEGTPSEDSVIQPPVMTIEDQPLITQQGNSTSLSEIQLSVPENEVNAVERANHQLEAPGQKTSNESVNASENDSFFESQIELTDHWLQTAAESTASIQIMTLVDSPQSRDSLKVYLSKLKLQSIDITPIRIFSSAKSDRDIIGVLYGEYPNRELALKKIDDLPPVLKTNRPIPRTVRGISKEIQRQKH